MGKKKRERVKDHRISALLQGMSSIEMPLAVRT